MNIIFLFSANFLEIEVCRPVTHTDEKGKRFTDYEVHMRTNLPIFKYEKQSFGKLHWFCPINQTSILQRFSIYFFRLKEFSTRRRYSDFEWLRNEIERAVAIHIPELPPKAYFKQLPFMNSDDGIFESEFIEDRRQGLEEFINHLAGHPLVQNEKCLHFFLLEARLDKGAYVPGKIGYMNK